MKREVASATNTTGDSGRMRLDKWLWVARFYRTRSLAAQAIDAGHVRVNDERVKPSQSVCAATRVSVRKQALTWHVDVVDLAKRRGSVADAALLFSETAPSVAAREAAMATRKAAVALATAPGRPTKRDRRKLEDLLNEP